MFQTFCSLCYKCNSFIWQGSFKWKQLFCCATVQVVFFFFCKTFCNLQVWLDKTTLDMQLKMSNHWILIALLRPIRLCVIWRQLCKCRRWYTGDLWPAPILTTVLWQQNVKLHVTLNNLITAPHIRVGSLHKELNSTLSAHLLLCENKQMHLKWSDDFPE